MSDSKTVTVGGVEYRPCDVPAGAQQAARHAAAVEAAETRKANRRKEKDGD